RGPQIPQVVLGDHRARLGVAHDVLDLPAAIEDVDRNEDHSELDAGEEDVDQLDAIGEIDAEAITFLKAAIAQCVCHAITAPLDLAEGELLAVPLQANLVAAAEEGKIE